MRAVFSVFVYFFFGFSHLFSRDDSRSVWGLRCFRNLRLQALAGRKRNPEALKKKSKLDGPREESCSGVRDATGEILGSYLYKSLLHFSHAFTCATENTPLPIESASQRRRLTAIRKSIGDPRLFLRL
jgi:hypothetical protein